MEAGELTVSLASARIAIGVVSVVAPGFAGRVPVGAHHIRASVLPGAVGLAAAGALLSAWLARQLDPT